MSYARRRSFVSLLAAPVRNIVAGAAALLLLWAHPHPARAQAPEPGLVNCKAPSPALDVKTICATPDLMVLDGEMDRAYRAARIRWTSSLSNSIKVVQIDWLKDRAKCGADAKCIFSAYVKRITELDKERPDSPTWLLDMNKPKTK